MTQVYEAIYPNGKFRRARKDHRCDYGPPARPCPTTIRRGELYFDPLESNPDRAGGFGGFRFCINHWPKWPGGVS